MQSDRCGSDFHVTYSCSSGQHSNHIYCQEAVPHLICDLDEFPWPTFYSFPIGSWQQVPIRTKVQGTCIKIAFSRGRDRTVGIATRLSNANLGFNSWQSPDYSMRTGLFLRLKCPWSQVKNLHLHPVPKVSMNGVLTLLAYTPLHYPSKF
jgi:hypothetical protein